MAGLSQALLQGLSDFPMGPARAQECGKRRVEAWIAVEELQRRLEGAPKSIKPLHVQWAIGRCLGLQHALPILEAHEGAAHPLSAEDAAAYEKLVRAVSQCEECARRLKQAQVELSPAVEELQLRRLMVEYFCSCGAGISKLWSENNGKKKSGMMLEGIAHN